MFADVRFDVLRKRVQRSLVELAFEWTSAYAEENGEDATDPVSVMHRKVQAFLDAGDSYDPLGDNESRRPLLFVSGHQPEIFHTGVWFKNLVISKLANCYGGLAVNLIIDHDLPKHHSINVPYSDTSGNIAIRGVPFIELRANRPWEELDIQAAKPIREFADQVQEFVSESLPTPCMVEDYWDDVIAKVNDGYLPGEAIAIARHRLELQSKWATLELPLSRLCNDWSFGCFVAEMLHRANDVRDAYNEARALYRSHHKIRNAAHPVPPLATEHGDGLERLETPFWIYKSDSPKRYPLWLVKNAQGWHLSNGESELYSLKSGDLAILTESDWEQLQRQELKIRPRALMTTTFLRLFAADLFVHGIGGGKYDQVTDLIIRQLFDIAPPQFLVASASLFLPLASPTEIAHQNGVDIRTQLRRAKYNPEQFLTNEQHANPKIARLVVEKKQLLQKIPARGEKKAWHARLHDVNQQLAMEIEEQFIQLNADLEDAIASQRQHKLLSSREYSFVLHDRVEVVQRLGKLAEINCPGQAELVPAQS